MNLVFILCNKNQSSKRILAVFFHKILDFLKSRSKFFVKRGVACGRKTRANGKKWIRHSDSAPSNYLKAAIVFPTLPQKSFLLICVITFEDFMHVVEFLLRFSKSIQQLF